MIYYLVRFIEDDILYVCSEQQVRKGPDSIKKVRYKNYGLYDAEILSSGGKSDMYKELTLRQEENRDSVNVDNPDTNIPENHILSEDSCSSAVCMPNIVISCKKQLNFDTCENTMDMNVSINDMENKNISVSELVSKQARISEIPVCCAIININKTSGSIDLVVETMLHAGIYSGMSYAKEDDTFSAIIIDNEECHHQICVPIETNKPTGLMKLDLKTLLYDFNVRCCMNQDTYRCQGYLVNSNNSLIGEFKLENSPICTSTSPSILHTKNTMKRKCHCCPFCKKMQFAFGRHIITKHRSEVEVEELLALPKGSSDRRNKLSILRGRGMYIYNTDSSINTGNILVVRNPKTNDPDSFVPCPNCKGYFLPRNVSRHQKRCVNRPANKCRVLSVSKELKNPAVQADQVLLQKLLSQLREDIVTDTIKNDKILLLLASKMAVKYAKEKHLGNFMRQKLRQLARLLLKMKMIDNQITDLESCLVPNKYNTFKNAIYELCELDTNNFTYKRPSMASQLGAMIKECAGVLKIQNIKDGNSGSRQQQQIEDFLLIHEKEYGALVAKSAVTTLEQNKWNKKQIMPSIDDIQKFQDYIKVRAENSFNSLANSGFDYNVWLTLGRSCLLILLTFNRRRVGEISRLLIETFLKRQAIEQEQYKSLTRLESILADTFQRMEIRGKKGRRVPVLITKRHIEYIELFLKFRTNAGVSNVNPFVYGVTHKKGYIDAAVAIREYSEKCGAREPESLRGTYLRKQVATISQMLNLNDNEIQQLADFMGHEVAIHRLHYRKPEINLQITRLSKFFMAVGGVDVEKYRGKSLDEIEVMDNSLPENDYESDTSTSSDQLQNEAKQNLANEDDNGTKYAELDSPDRKMKRRSYRHKIMSPLKSPSRYSCSRFDDIIKSPVRRIVPRRVRWSKSERDLITKEFKYNLENNTVPTADDCFRFRNKNKSVLASRSVAHIKAWINNQNKKKQNV